MKLSKLSQDLWLETLNGCLRYLFSLWNRPINRGLCLSGSLQRVISHYPQILSFPVKKLSAVSRLLREKCQFTAQQMADILRDSPHVVEEDPARLEYMFQVGWVLFIIASHIIVTAGLLFSLKTFLYHTTSCVRGRFVAFHHFQYAKLSSQIFFYWPIKPEFKPPQLLATVLFTPFSDYLSIWVGCF